LYLDMRVIFCRCCAVGIRRYVLLPPSECSRLHLLPRQHPSARHSALDWSNISSVRDLFDIMCYAVLCCADSTTSFCRSVATVSSVLRARWSFCFCLAKCSTSPRIGSIISPRLHQVCSVMHDLGYRQWQLKLTRPTTPNG